MAWFWFIVFIVTNFMWFRKFENYRVEAERRFDRYRKKTQSVRAISRKRKEALAKFNSDPRLAGRPRYKG